MGKKEKLITHDVCGNEVINNEVIKSFRKLAEHISYGGMNQPYTGNTIASILGGWGVVTDLTMMSDPFVVDGEEMKNQTEVSKFKTKDTHLSVGCILKTPTGEYVLAKHDNKVSYMTGTVENDESLEECLHRELMEEFGAICTILKYHDTSRIHVSDKRGSFVKSIVWFECRLESIDDTDAEVKKENIIFTSNPFSLGLDIDYGRWPIRHDGLIGSYELRFLLRLLSTNLPEDVVNKEAWRVVSALTNTPSHIATEICKRHDMDPYEMFKISFRDNGKYEGPIYKLVNYIP